MTHLPDHEMYIICIFRCNKEKVILGNKSESRDSSRICYESVKWQGVEYRLADAVYLRNDEAPVNKARTSQRDEAVGILEYMLHEERDNMEH